MSSEILVKILLVRFPVSCNQKSPINISLTMLGGLSLLEENVRELKLNLELDESN